MAPTFRQLRYFSVLAEELHFGRTAAKLHISQPPLSASIQQLEKDIGASLLDRTSRQVRLTPAGEAFAERAKRLLEDLDESTNLARAVAASPGGIIRVGFVPSTVFLGLTNIIERFGRKYPGYGIELREMNSGAQLTALEEGRLELGFVHQFTRDEDINHLEALPIAHQPFVCCLPADHPLARRTTISLAEIGRQPLIMFSRDRAPAFHDHIVGLFTRAQVTPKIVHHIGNWLTILALVGFGMGVSLVPGSLAKVGIGRAVFVSLEEDWAECDVHCVWSSSHSHEGRDYFIACLHETPSV